MTTQYKSIHWNNQKKRYDQVLALLIVCYMAFFIVVSKTFDPSVPAETLLMRALSTAAFILLHVILSIGPLCRLDKRFLPLLYNRRHMGVTMFGLATCHAVIAFVQQHWYGIQNPLVSLLWGEGHWSSWSQIPYQPMGLFAWVILLFMAVTSHDFWLKNLSPKVWKSLHMGVYLAYALIVMHVLLGIVQHGLHPLLLILLGFGFVWLAGLHLRVGWLECQIDSAPKAIMTTGWVKACRVEDIPNHRAKVMAINQERIAIFREDDQVYALSNVCAHQHGPLGEGKIIKGCVTCPWHGYQYDPATGASPPPFHEKVETYAVRIDAGEVWISVQAHTDQEEAE